jgi:hypothetical protein
MHQICRRLGHDWREVGNSLQCRTCRVSVSNTFSGGSIESQLREAEKRHAAYARQEKEYYRQNQETYSAQRREWRGGDTLCPRCAAKVPASGVEAHMTFHWENDKTLRP